MVAQPAQSHINIGRRALVQHAVVKAHLGVVLAVNIALLGISGGEEHAHGRHFMTDKGKVLAAAAGSNDRVLISGEERRFLETAQTDEIYKVFN